MVDKPERHNPRWDIVNKLYDAIDESIVSIGAEDKMNFIEISIALNMINKKINYEEFKSMLEFNVEQVQKEIDEREPEGMYK